MIKMIDSDDSNDSDDSDYHDLMMNYDYKGCNLNSNNPFYLLSLAKMSSPRSEHDCK